MKIPQNQIDAMRELIYPLDTLERREFYRMRQFPRQSVVKDLNMRYRWDLFYESGALNVIQSARDSGAEYTNAHIDSALRSIVPAL